MTYIDAHHLLGVDHWLSLNKPELAHVNTREGAAAQLAPTGSGVAVVFPFPSSRDGSYEAENAAILEAAAADPRLVPVLAVNPGNEKARGYLPDLLRRHPEVAGFAVWPILCDLDLPDLARDDFFRDLLAEFPRPVTVHVGAGNEQAMGRVARMKRYLPADAVELARSIPEVRFNLSHALRLSAAALEAAAELPNVYSDVSGLSCLNALYERGQHVFPAADAGGLAARTAPQVLAELFARPGLAAKLMFGSSYPFSLWWGFDVAGEVAWTSGSGLNPADLERLYLKTALEFYGERLARAWAAVVRTDNG